jgi:hypothetical protein
MAPPGCDYVLLDLAAGLQVSQRGYRSVKLVLIMLVCLIGRRDYFCHSDRILDLSLEVDVGRPEKTQR